MAGRNWMFTIFKNNEENFSQVIQSLSQMEHNQGTYNSLKFLVFQWEVTPSTGQLHAQGYAEFSKMTTLKQAKEILGCQTTHLEKRKGSQDDAINYCTKLDSRAPEQHPFIWGKKARQGERTDLQSALQDIKKKNKTIIEIIDEQPHLIRIINHLQKYQQLCEEPRKREDPIEVNVLIGEPGTGKTKYVFDNEKDLYVVPEPQNGNVWFDGYQGQEAVLFDDYYGQCKYHYLLRLLDRYPMQVPIKGGFTQWKPKRIYLTSNKQHHQWYSKPDIRALDRRIHKIFIFEAGGNTMHPQITLLSETAYNK